MKRKILWLTLMTAVCAFNSLHADLTIVEHIDGWGKNWDSTLLFKDAHARFFYPLDQASPAPGDAEPAHGPATAVTSIIFDLKSGEMITLMSAVKIYIRNPEMSPADRAAMMQPDGLLKDGGTSLRPTGKRDTISGFAVNEYAGSVSGRKMTVWLTRAMPDYESIVKQLSAAFAQSPIVATIKMMGTDLTPLPWGIPVRTIYESKSGQIVCTMLSISAVPIADSAFQIPADYKQITPAHNPR